VLTEHPELDNDYSLKGAFTVNNGGTADGRKNAVAAPLKMPLRVIKRNMSIWFLLQANQLNEHVTKPKKVNAFDLLMKPKTVNLQKKESNNNKHTMFNDTIDLYKSKVSVQGHKKVQDLIQTVTDCLWEIDSNTNTFLNASVNGHCPALPTLFEPIYHKPYRNWQAQKKAKPRLDQQVLHDISGKLFEKLEFWESSHEKIDQDFAKASRKLAECLHRYSEYLCKTRDQVSKSSEGHIDDFFNENITNPVEAINKSKLDNKFMFMFI